MSSPFPFNAPGVVTRVEVIDHIGEAFTGVPLTRNDLLSAAQRVGARPAVIELLGTLPDRRFARPQELWNDLGHVPIEH
ncbi:MAG TPA: DUF2795 domain-containing protein [Acidimicrobiales bacterium]|nr:DUF2795 domain-containing protein [Acidimicrobiales bacterium]